MKKKIFGLVSALSLAALCVNAQTPGTASTSDDKTISVQIRAGVNFQNFNGKLGSNDDYEGKLNTGFHAGVEVPILIAPDFYIQPGALFSVKGSKSKNNDDFKTHLGYIEIPVNFVYKPMLGSGHLILGVGPYMGIGITGKVKSGDNDIDVKFDNNVTSDNFDAAPYFKRTDFGGNLLAGYEFSNKLFFQLNAQLGLTNILPKVEGEDSDNFDLKNTGFGVSVGYRF